MSGRFEGLLVPSRKRKDEEKHVNHVAKRVKKTKGVEVVFDEKAHREFVTGFRRRKQQRRVDAQSQLKDKERQAKIITRAERRTKLKEELGFGDNWGMSSDEEGQVDKAAVPAADKGAATASAAAEVAVYEGQDTLTTVTTAPLALYSDPESEEEKESGEEDSEGEQSLTAALAHRALAKNSASKKTLAQDNSKKKKEHAKKQRKSCAGTPRSKKKQAEKPGRNKGAKGKKGGGGR
mmetsp:Transcript_16538/g.28338  ORF Transcript_16538/g.28338 Transcript_16538/m.28338 type:complete len:236 (-) Transcript_16538:263-970(-)|eukprot:CAMPEP_0119108804 /NCGR_PEP_ID=MMETSP1180-20130426/15669_1 /TAXON_ID=3052 ORGANISM="Chlamydomonas cf sp, Strain CCMP681" /NCGR_SAMPLE_ID=MMETSP1180 /ASSEMBLY_ACC=CAM_ASM_000741 /LENGTH=235 /DNA_ID=CAMNT_0007094461 /DNA_START=11 /DNA_END=718 /DNA_ORIENTATION=+